MHVSSDAIVSVFKSRYRILELIHEIFVIYKLTSDRVLLVFAPTETISGTF